MLPNQSISHVVINLKRPKEVYHGYSPDYFDLKIFSCLAYAHVKNGKLDPRSKKCIFLRYETQNDAKGYKL